MFQTNLVERRRGNPGVPGDRPAGNGASQTTNPKIDPSSEPGTWPEMTFFED